MESYKEKSLTDYPETISFECSKIIIEQMQKYICKINIGNEQGTGFFCKIPIPNRNRRLPVLITNNHVINENLLNTNNTEIQLDIKDENDIKKINLHNREKYTNKEYDVTIIELKEKDDIKNYLVLDDTIINGINDNIRNKEYLKQTIYILQYPKGELSVSYGKLDSILENKKYEFNHKCITYMGSSGSPILNIKNNKVIGIHKEGSDKHNYNKGTFLNYPIKEFIIRYQNNIQDINALESSNNSNLSHKDNNKYESKILKNLIKTLYLKKELSLQTGSPKIYNGFIVKNEIINKLKEYYSLKDIIHFLDRNRILDGVNYQNFHSKYPIIENYLNIYQAKYMSLIKQNEKDNKIKFSKNDGLFEIKKFNYYLTYIDNFEIINEEFTTLLLQKYEIDIIPIKFIINNKKFILAINDFNRKDFYEIATPNINGNLMIEYIIDIYVKNEELNDTNLLNSYLFKTIFDLGIKEIIDAKILKNSNIGLYIEKGDKIKVTNLKKEEAIMIKMKGEYELIPIKYSKTIRELKKQFFNRIKRPDLIENQNIVFLKGQQILKLEDPISKYFDKDIPNNIIYVIDQLQNNLQKKIIFQSPSQLFKIELIIGINDSIKKIAKFFVEKAYKLNYKNYSLKKENFYFIYNGIVLSINSNELLNKYIGVSDGYECYFIVIDIE